MSESGSEGGSIDSAIFFFDDFRHVLDEKTTDPEVTQPLFEVVEILGKGLGIVATRDLERGERILVEKPLILHDRCFDDAEIIAKYETLSSSDKSQIDELHNVRPNSSKTHPILGIIWTNSIALTKQVSGLFITASRLNHACVPNAAHSWNDALKAVTVHATKPIRKGEEVTDSYLEGFATQADRRAHLADVSGFLCDCPHCCLLGVDKEQSDHRVERITALSKKLALDLPHNPYNGPDIISFSNFHKILKLLSYYEAEGIAGSQIIEAYEYAFRLSCRLNLPSRIVESGRRVIELQSTIKGDDHPDTIIWRGRLQSVEARLTSTATEDESPMGPPPDGDRERKLWLFISAAEDSPEDWGDLYSSSGTDEEVPKAAWSVVRRTRK